MPEKPFGLRSCRDMRDKLERELGRLASATNRDDLIDHGINAALTAWHLTDWAWVDLGHRPELRAQLSREARVNAGSFSLDDFRRLVVRLCPDLAYCRIVTNDAKHLGSDRHTDDPGFTTAVAPAEVTWVNAKGEPVRWVNAQGEPVTWTSEAWDLVITQDDGTRRRAVDVLGRALNWWTEFIYGHAIDEPQEPLPE
jgi:hypothetical protein